ncbi:MAG: arginine decarboxylase, partial [Candidatus Eisenbacteria bacterium]|nr:arginine decarboxylase [Candidatus Eisenbacteria bacterium]
GYVQYSKSQLMQKMRQANEEALRKGLLTFEESALLMKRYDEGLSGYTYLEEEPAPLHLPSNGNGGSSSGLMPRPAGIEPVKSGVAGR